MRTDKYYLASAKVAEQGRLTDCRYRTQDGRYLLSESDIRSMVAGGRISFAELSQPHIEETDPATAKALIARGGYAIAGSGGVTAETDNKSEEPENEEEE